MKILGRRTLARTAGFLAVGALAYAASVMTATGQANAQITDGEFWLYQPQQSGPVGRAWCNPAHTVEYWAYVDGEYQFPDAANVQGGHWTLEVQRVSTSGYPTFNCFIAAVRALPEMAQKSIRFENHSVQTEFVDNN